MQAIHRLLLCDEFRSSVTLLKHRKKMNKVSGRPPANTNTAHSHGLSSVNLKIRCTMDSYWGQAIAEYYIYRWELATTRQDGSAALRG